MSESSQPPRKDSELTLRIDRSLIPPTSAESARSVGLDPTHPEVAALIADTRDRMRNAPTMVPCPLCEAKPCPCCGMRGMVTHDALEAYNILTSIDDPGDAK